MIRAQGLSLIELTAVIAILGIVALVTIPNFSSTDPQKLETATSLVVDALNHAREESIRIQAGLDTGNGGVNPNYGIEALVVKGQSGEVSVQTFSLDSGVPVSQGNATDPLAKKPYSLNVMTFSLTRGVAFINVSAAFAYQDGNRQFVLFDATGRPFWLAPDTGYQRLLNGTIDLQYGGHRRRILLDGMTGRVRVE